MGENDGRETPDDQERRDQRPGGKEDAVNKPGYIPEPEEKSWDAETQDPFEGVDRSNPFEGRPPSKQVPQAEEPPAGEGGAAPGQPLPRTRHDGEDLD